MEVDGNGWDRKVESFCAHRETQPGEIGRDRSWPLPGRRIFYRPAGTEVLWDAIMCVKKQRLVYMASAYLLSKLIYLSQKLYIWITSLGRIKHLTRYKQKKPRVALRSRRGWGFPIMMMLRENVRSNQITSHITIWATDALYSSKL